MFGLINMVNDGGYGSGAYVAPSYTAPSYTDGGSTLSYSSPTSVTNGGGGDTSGNSTATAPPSAGSPYAYGAPIGDRPPYTPLDFPLMHELQPGQRLKDLSTTQPQGKPAQTGWLLLGLVALLVFKGPVKI